MSNPNKERLTLRLSEDSQINRDIIRPKSMERVFKNSPRRAFRQSGIGDLSLETVQEQPSLESQKRRETKIGARTTARFHAIQALYQFDMTRMHAEQILDFFKTTILGEPMDNEVLIAPDYAHFKALVEGTIQNLEEINNLLQARLLKGWALHRLDRVICALLRVSCFELVFLKKTQPRIIINEFVTVATTFFDGGEAIGLINGMLDGLARCHHLFPEGKPSILRPCLESSHICENAVA